MRPDIIRTLGKHALWRAGGYSLLAGARPWRGVAVLAYHGLRNSERTVLGTSEELHVRVSVFERHLQVLQELSTPISLAQWRQASNDHRPLPPRAVLLTFDDGYRSVAELGLPLLERYGIPAVMFVCTGPPASRDLMWYDALERLGRAAEIEPAKRLPYDAWRDLVDNARVAMTGGDERALMTPHQIATMAQHPLIEIGAHTVDHPILARASSVVQRQQIEESVRTLRMWTGTQPRAFAYPNGLPGRDFTSETMAMMADAGIDRAFSTEPRFATSADHVHAIPRFTMLDTISEAQLAQCLAISWRRAL